MGNLLKRTTPPTSVLPGAAWTRHGTPRGSRRGCPGGSGRGRRPVRARRRRRGGRTQRRRPRTRRTSSTRTSTSSTTRRTTTRSRRGGSGAARRGAAAASSRAKTGPRRGSTRSTTSARPSPGNSGGQNYKVVIPRHAGLEDSYVHSHHPNVLSEAMARIFVAGIRANAAHHPLCYSC